MHLLVLQPDYQMFPQGVSSHGTFNTRLVDHVHGTALDEKPLHRTRLENPTELEVDDQPPALLSDNG